LNIRIKSIVQNSQTTSLNFRSSKGNLLECIFTFSTKFVTILTLGCRLHWKRTSLNYCIKDKAQQQQAFQFRRQPNNFEITFRSARELEMWQKLCITFSKLW